MRNLLIRTYNELEHTALFFNSFNADNFLFFGVDFCIEKKKLFEYVNKRR